MLKVNDKERNLKPARVKRTATYKGITVRLSAGFSADTLQARREQNDILETLKDKTVIQEYSIQPGYKSDMKKKLKAF